MRLSYLLLLSNTRSYNSYIFLLLSFRSSTFLSISSLLFCNRLTRPLFFASNYLYLALSSFSPWAAPVVEHSLFKIYYLSCAIANSYYFFCLNMPKAPYSLQSLTFLSCSHISDSNCFIFCSARFIS